jgi:hypothetical protein
VSLRYCFGALLSVSLLLSGCSDGNDSGSGDGGNSEAVLDFESYTWNEISSGGYWDPRAGLQTVELRGRFYLLGGRTPNPPMMPFPIPGDSKIWSDVWVSDDSGVSWSNILSSGVETHWAPRAYFKAVTVEDYIYVIGGQDFTVAPTGCPPFLSPDVCPPFAAQSQFFNDVWRSKDGVNWELMTSNAGWSPRAGLSATVLNGEIYVLGGSVNDDSSIVGGPPLRVYFNDVWKSKDGSTWQQLTDAAPWPKRAGAELVTKGEYLYLLGGEEGFLCEPEPDCKLPYFNDVWRSKDGIAWELVTAAANWSARPGHQCGVIRGRFVCFGGFGRPENPVDVWVSEDGARWQLLSSPPWNARSGEDIKYDFDIIVTDADNPNAMPAIYTFGGDRETFDFDDPLNYLRVDDDVWRFTNPEL